MAIRPRNVFSSISGFFFSPRRRTRSAGGGKVEDPALVKFVSGFDEAFVAANAPEQVAENYRKDITDAFKVKATPRSGYDPGSYGPPISVNIADFFTDPVKTVVKTASSVFDTEWSSLVANPIDVWKETDAVVLDRLHRTWAGYPAGGARPDVIPSSLFNAFEQWNAVAGSTDDSRRLRDVRKNPGYTLMPAKRLEQHYTGLGMAGPLLGGQTLTAITAATQSREAELTQVLARAENEVRSGNFGQADLLYKEAAGIQKAWEGQSRGYRKEIDGLFDWHAVGGALAGTPEAQFRRYWMNRNTHYQTLNFLRTWKKDGFPGAFKEYIWKQVVKDHVFVKGTPLYYLYPPHLLEYATGKTIGGLVKPLVDRLYTLRAAFVRLRDKFTKDIAKKLLNFIGTKLGLKALA